jgi:hypothetical protein
MGFLDNSGDIILDAVLTDTGRFRLAKGDGSFKIVKFALGDDEINYGLYNKNHASGSAFFDLEVLQTPVFEAFTNNTSTMQYKLLSIPRTNLLYLPVLKINSVTTNSKTNSGNDGFVVAVNTTTKTDFGTTEGVINGEAPAAEHIRIDQGLDTTEVTWTATIDADLKETQYIVEVDNRLGVLSGRFAGVGITPPSFIDDDMVASYYFSGPSPSTAYVNDVRTINAQAWNNASNNNTFPSAEGTIQGPQGTALRFQIESSRDLKTSNFLFEKLGSSALGSALTSFGLSGASTYNYIDTIVKVTGATTGYRLDIPVRFIKKA